LLRSVGYRGLPLPGVPFDERAGVIPHVQGRVQRDGSPATGEYVVGWIKRGPRGIIGTNKPDSQETVRMLLEDLAAGRLDKPEVPSRAVLERLLAERRHDFVSYDDWQLIDLLEQERGAGARPRV
jgi:ferredoxin--NADP+ reductase